ncbi:MAG: pyruvate ferredoxin oxidoreductase [bacterium]|nr:pyruvate ferredoxin oxidoreductase [bacterium]
MIAQEEPKTKVVAKYPAHVKKVLKGNYAAAEAAKLCRVEFIPSYPITPQTTIVEKLASMIAEGELDATYVNMDSEHSVFAAAKGASLGGSRVFTATSGQGLLYAHEVLHAIAHMRLPIVACNIGRPSFPWNIWCDHSDSISQRDTGWVQFYGETAQETLDTLIQSYMLAEQLRLPVFVMLDAFYQSHTSENIWIPDQALVDTFLPKRDAMNESIDPTHPKSFGGLVPSKFYDHFNQAYWTDINLVEDLTNEIGAKFGKHFGRNYGAVEAVNINKNTKTILVTIASIVSTTRGVIQTHPEVGMLKIRLFKPFPKKSILIALKDISKDCVIVNIDRNFTGDNEGALMREMKTALYGKTYKMYNVYAGLGGRDVPPSTIERIIEKVANQSMEEVCWIDLD